MLQSDPSRISHLNWLDHEDPVRKEWLQSEEDLGEEVAHVYMLLGSGPFNLLATAQTIPPRLQAILNQDENQNHQTLTYNM